MATTTTASNYMLEYILNMCYKVHTQNPSERFDSYYACKFFVCNLAQQK